MKLRFILILTVICLSEHLFSQEVIEKSLSPNKEIGIVVTKDKDFNKSFYLQNLKTNKRLAMIASQKDGRSYSDVIIASWNPNSTKVALLITYRKLNYVTIFARNRHGLFVEVKFQSPDPIKYYEARGGAPFPSVPGFNENGVGTWKGNDIVSLISGDAKEFDTGLTHFFISYKAEVKNLKAKIFKIKPEGKLSDEEAAAFMQQWHESY